MAATVTLKGTIDKCAITGNSGGSTATYLGFNTGPNGWTGSPGDQLRAIRIAVGATGNIIVKIDKSFGLLDMQIFQEDAYQGSSAPANYQRYYNIAKAGKDKGAVGITVTNAAKTFILLLKFDTYAGATYSGSIAIP